MSRRFSTAIVNHDLPVVLLLILLPQIYHANKQQHRRGETGRIGPFLGGRQAKHGGAPV